MDGVVNLAARRPERQQYDRVNDDPGVHGMASLQDRGLTPVMRRIKVGVCARQMSGTGAYTHPSTDVTHNSRRAEWL